VLLGAPALAAPPAAGDVDDPFTSTPAERDLARLLSSQSESGPFLFRCRPGGKAEGDARAALEERLGEALGKATALLSWKPEKRLPVYVYESPREMSELTGRSAREAACVDDALHLFVDREGKAPLGAAIARALESPWGRAGEKPGAGLDGGRWVKVKLRSRAGRVDVSLGERRLSSVELPGAAPTAGMIGLGVEEGRIAVRNLKVRGLAPEGDPAQEWVSPLRPPADTAWIPEVPGRFRIADEEALGVRYHRMTRMRWGGGQWKDVEVECEMRISEGATAELAIQATAATPGVRLLIGPSFIVLVSGEGRRRPISGPFSSLREGLSQAVAAAVDGTPLHATARALVDRGVAPPKDLLRTGVSPSAGDKLRRALLYGSFVAWAIETHGPEKYRDLHFADIVNEPKTPLGDLADLDAAWRTWLKARPLTKEERAKAERRIGLDVMADTSGWMDLGDKIKAGKVEKKGGGTLTTADGALEFAGAVGAKLEVKLPVVVPERVALRAEVRLGEGARVRIVVKDRDGRSSAAVLSASGAQLISPDNAIAGRSDFGLEEDRPFEVALVLDGLAGRIYIDGLLAAEAPGGLSGGPGALRIDLEGRAALVSRIAVRGAE